VVLATGLTGKGVDVRWQAFLRRLDLEPSG
jgi:hypothetical protein